MKSGIVFGLSRRFIGKNKTKNKENYCKVMKNNLLILLRMFIDLIKGRDLNFKSTLSVPFKREMCINKSIIIKLQNSLKSDKKKTGVSI